MRNPDGGSSAGATNRLYKNNRDGTFTDVTEKAGLVRTADVTRQAGLLYTGNTRWGSGCTFVDYNRDGHLDLFVANYVDLNLHKLPKPGENPYCNFKGVPVNCGPRGLPMGRNYLYRNQGDGTFQEVTVANGISKATSTYAMTAVAADFDSDGWTDLYVASDSTPSLLFRNQRNGTLIGIDTTKVEISEANIILQVSRLSQERFRCRIIVIS